MCEGKVSSGEALVPKWKRSSAAWPFQPSALGGGRGGSDELMLSLLHTTPSIVHFGFLDVGSSKPDKDPDRAAVMLKTGIQVRRRRKTTRSSVKGGALRSRDPHQ